jgi:hypothetical protein
MKGLQQFIPWMSFSPVEMDIFNFKIYDERFPTPWNLHSLGLLCSAAAAAASEFFRQQQDAQLSARLCEWEKKAWLIKNNISYQNLDEVRVKKWGDVCVYYYVDLCEVLDISAWICFLSLYTLLLLLLLQSVYTYPLAPEMERKSTQRRI